MYTLVSHIPIIIYYSHEPAYITYIVLDIDFINAIEFWQKRYHPLVTYPETVVLSFFSPKNDFSAFTFNPASEGLCRNFSKASRWYLQYFFVITSNLSMYARTM